MRDCKCKDQLLKLKAGKDILNALYGKSAPKKSEKKIEKRPLPDALSGASLEKRIEDGKE